jgi:hypothetical protein
LIDEEVDGLLDAAALEVVDVPLLCEFGPNVVAPELLDGSDMCQARPKPDLVRSIEEIASHIATKKSTSKQELNGMGIEV